MAGPLQKNKRVLSAQACYELVRALRELAGVRMSVQRARATSHPQSASSRDLASAISRDRNRYLRARASLHQLPASSCDLAPVICELVYCNKMSLQARNLRAPSLGDRPSSQSGSCELNLRGRILHHYELVMRIPIRARNALIFL